MERFANRHRKVLNELFGTHIAKSPSDSPFHLSLAQLDVERFEGLLRNLLSARLNSAEAIDSLIRDGMTLSGSVAENAAGAERYGLRLTSSPLLK
jgi:hypothetical protein